MVKNMLNFQTFIVCNCFKHPVSQKKPKNRSRT